jgi:AraC family transcriptional regulator of adaptative response/methylated-DNA-[protein]-cysteine methyltransferase
MNVLSSVLHDIVTVSPADFESRSDEKLIYGVHSSPFGPALIAVLEDRLCGFLFQGSLSEDNFYFQAQRHLNTSLTHYRPDVTESFMNRALKEEVPPLILSGTPFQLSVWKILTQIPKGSVVTYQELAETIGSPRAMRSIGQALKANPIAYILPCHRVISASGRLGGYRWGVLLKKNLLEAEGISEFEGDDAQSQIL